MKENSKERTKQDLLDLLDTDDLDILWQKYELPESTEKKIKNPIFLSRIDSLAQTTLLQDIMNCKTDSVEMLKDVFSFLETEEMSIRTTGFILSLEKEYSVSPQAINLAVNWNNADMNNGEDKSWGDILTHFKLKIKPIIQHLSDKAKPQTISETPSLGDIDIRDMVEAKKDAIFSGEPFQFKERKTLKYNNAFLDKFHLYIKELSGLSNNLTVNDNGCDSERNQLAIHLNQTSNFYRKTITEYNSQITRAVHKQEDRYSANNLLNHSQLNAWNFFIETILFKLKKAENETVSDLFKIAIFRNRPQLYEIWILTTVLHYYKTKGFIIEILSKSFNNEKAKWKINFSKSSSPIASIASTGMTAKYFLFYQLFRKGEKRAEMPDIALLPSINSTATPLWIIDPKHSKSGYTIRYYEEVATRYQYVFNPTVSLISEYYPREISNPFTLKENSNTLLYTDVSPKGDGKGKLMEKLYATHGFRTTVVIDISSSYINEEQNIKEKIKRSIGAGVVFTDYYFLFADKVIEMNNLTNFLNETSNFTTLDFITNKTLFLPVINLLSDKFAKKLLSDSICVYSDGEFNDIDKNAALLELQKFCRVEIIG